MNAQERLRQTIAQLVRPGKGILAADESLPTIGKRFAAAGVDNTEDNRRAYRASMLTLPGLGEFLSGVILFEETLEQAIDDGTPLAVVLEREGVVPGIKVDKGKGPLAGAPGDQVTYGLDGLGARLAGYRERGARFAKWREVYAVGPRNPTPLGIEANAEMLARYAAVCQEEGFVPIVEPEVLIDGDHSLERCAEVSEAVLHAVFHALHRHHVACEYLVLKPSMVVPGKERAQRATPEQVAEATVRVLRRTVPAAVPSINFLSGGQGPEEATANLNAINARHPGQPWELSFSFARALQAPVMAAWAGQGHSVEAAQRAFRHRLRMNAAARRGEYRPALEGGA